MAANTFRMWADNHGGGGRLDLSRPPGPIEEWTISGISTDDGNLALDVPIWASVGSDRSHVAATCDSTPDRWAKGRASGHARPLKLALGQGSGMTPEQAGEIGVWM